jgi:MFS family permease
MTELESPMSYQPAENLTNRTFVGLIIAQFLAGFNDQAIHAAAMFYAMHTQILSDSTAIALMPVLFYAPWAIFCTLAGFYADKYSKTLTLRLWKWSEVLISVILIIGFYLGSNSGMPLIGGWIVMACVFLMGTHAAFFAPAKYGAMPEILRPHILSRGNGILESTTFLASILGTVAGGLLFHAYSTNPIMIGWIILTLSIIGALASGMIAWLPAASPERIFPANPFKPLVENLRVMFRSRPLALAMLGIAFFIFMVSYMRASMYMHGQSRNPRWDEETTSLIVATVALGVGLGSPLAGFLSGGKIELGLVPLGCLGMILALAISALTIEHTLMLVIALIIIGFFSGFYMVPLYTLLQHRAPKKSKGELVATSNFVNVTGAIAASILFNILVQLSRLVNLTPEIPVTDHVAVGVLKDIEFTTHKHRKISKIAIVTDNERDNDIEFLARGRTETEQERRDREAREQYDLVWTEFGFYDEEFEEGTISFDDSLFDALGGVQKGDRVIVSRYDRSGARHYVIRKEGQPLRKIYDEEILPRYLFLGAALMTLGILILLLRKLPDFFVRTVFWLKSIGKYRIKAVGMQHLPTEGPVILVTNCENLTGCLQLISATDRTTKVVLVEGPQALDNGALLIAMARRVNLIMVNPSEDATHARNAALKTLEDGHILAISLHNEKHAADIAELLHQLRTRTGAPILPTYCGAINEGAAGVTPNVRVVFGEIMPQAEPKELMFADCKKAIAQLGEWIKANDATAGTEHH